METQFTEGSAALNAQTNYGSSDAADAADALRSLPGGLLASHRADDVLAASAEAPVAEAATEAPDARTCVTQLTARNIRKVVRTKYKNKDSPEHHAASTKYRVSTL